MEWPSFWNSQITHAIDYQSPFCFYNYFLQLFPTEGTDEHLCQVIPVTTANIDKDSVMLLGFYVHLGHFFHSMLLWGISNFLLWRTSKSMCMFESIPFCCSSFLVQWCTNTQIIHKYVVNFRSEFVHCQRPLEEPTNRDRNTFWGSW